MAGDTAIAERGRFVGELETKLLADTAEGLYQLLVPLSYVDQGGEVFTAPAGFQTDFCSVPRVPLAYMILGNRARKAGTIHDWLYTAKPVNRKRADELLREMVQVDGISKVEAWLFWAAVRIGGGSHWQ